MADEYIVRIEDPIYIQAVSSVDPLLVYLRGYSAYQVAVQAGFDGTREEWLASLAEEATLICEGYRDEAEGFRNEAQTARDELDPVLINIATLLAIGAKLTEIDTVSDNIDAILAINNDLILGSSSKIGIVAGSIANVNNVGGSIADVNAVSGKLTEVETVADDLDLGLSSKIGIVSGSIANVNNVGASIANVNSVAEKLSEVETVAGDLTNIDTVAGSIGDVETVSDNMDFVVSAADRMGNFIVYVSDDAISVDLCIGNNLVVSESVEGYPSVILDLETA